MLLKGVLTTDADSPHDQESCPSHLWHIGIQYLTPFRPTLRICKLANPDQALTGPIDVNATNMYSTLRAATKTLDFTCTWHLQFFHLRETNRPLARFNPNNVVMVPYEGAASHQVWPRPGRGGGRKTKKTCGRGPTSDEGGAHDGDHDVDDEHEPEEEDVGSEDAEDPDEVTRVRELNKLLEDARSSMETRAKADREKESSDQDRDGKSQAASVPTSDISLTPIPSGVVSSASCSVSVSDPETECAKSRAASTVAEAAAQVLYVPGGVIRYYRKGNFTATCSRHDSCVKSRQSTESKVGLKSENNKAKGRPLGFLMTWLAMNEHAGCNSKKKHWNNTEIAKKCDHGTRLMARLSLNAMDGGPEMLQHERPPRAGEGDEPKGLA
jgi:hypothetical protein